jgi:hypothetical protein
LFAVFWGRNCMNQRLLVLLCLELSAAAWGVPTWLPGCFCKLPVLRA